ncbi:MAG: DUF819 family protein [Bacteroidota bacterium]
MQPLITNDAVVFGILMLVLAFVFTTADHKEGFWNRFYKVVPTLLMCYLIPALLAWPLGLIGYSWYDFSALSEALQAAGHAAPPEGSVSAINLWMAEQGIESSDYAGYMSKTKLYFVASRYLLPAALILLCLSIDFKGFLKLGSKALIMFFAATLGIVIGGPIALWATNTLFPGLVNIPAGELGGGLATIAGSWIGGGANQTAMKEIFNVEVGLFGQMVVVDIIVANIWLGVLLYLAGRTERVNRWLRADNSSVEELKERVEAYAASIMRMPTTVDLFKLLGITFGAVGLSHFGADFLSSTFGANKESLDAAGLQTLYSHFFWLVVISTTLGLIMSFTKLRRMEGVGAGRWGTVCIYVLVATIGMQMNIGDILNNLGLFVIGLIWMSIHVGVLLLVAYLTKSPYFFVAVGSQANVGGAASAPVVASYFSPALAPVGVLMAVVGYAVGTYGALLCAYLMGAG